MLQFVRNLCFWCFWAEGGSPGWASSLLQLTSQYSADSLCSDDNPTPAAFCMSVLVWCCDCNLFCLISAHFAAAYVVVILSVLVSNLKLVWVHRVNHPVLYTAAGSFGDSASSCTITCSDHRHTPHLHVKENFTCTVLILCKHFKPPFISLSFTSNDLCTRLPSLKVPVFFTFN